MSERQGQLLFIIDEAYAIAGAHAARFHNDRVTDPFGRFLCFVKTVNQKGARLWDSVSDQCLPRKMFVAAAQNCFRPSTGHSQCLGQFGGLNNPDLIPAKYPIDLQRTGGLPHRRNIVRGNNRISNQVGLFPIWGAVMK